MRKFLSHDLILYQVSSPVDTALCLLTWRGKGDTFVEEMPSFPPELPRPYPVRFHQCLYENDRVEDEHHCNGADESPEVASVQPAGVLAEVAVVDFALSSGDADGDPGDGGGRHVAYGKEVPALPGLAAVEHHHKSHEQHVALHSWKIRLAKVLNQGKNIVPIHAKAASQTKCARDVMIAQGSASSRSLAPTTVRKRSCPIRMQ